MTMFDVHEEVDLEALIVENAKCSLPRFGTEKVALLATLMKLPPPPTCDYRARWVMLFDCPHHGERHSMLTCDPHHDLLVSPEARANDPKFQTLVEWRPL